ncbi:MAG: aldo/keto reductase [Silicimonas sp.]
MLAGVNGIPVMGLGTFGLTGADGLLAMSSAIATGYRHVDTAQSYGTEENVGRAIAESGLPREDLFVTTKITETNLSRIGDSIDDSLKTMGLDYADLVLIHWPAQNDTPPVSSYVGELARAQDQRKTRLIGVSNFTRRHIDEAIEVLGEDRIATNQVERHVFQQNHTLAGHCAARGICITAYLPMVRGQLDDPVIARIATSHDATASQIALAYLLALGSVVIPKSGNAERQRSNFAATGITLEDDEIAALRTLDRGERHIDPDIAPDWD